MRIYLKYIFLFLIAGSIFSSCNQKDEKVYSFWALQNRVTGEYLYEDDGECKFSREKQGDKSLWKIAAAEGDYVCIVNKKSGRYLSLDNGQVVCSVLDQPVTESAEWYYGNFDFVT
ncbi:RICIN domain-containing protein, partial [Barnesiella intestinihominis]|uniref:RICIN domain-containing protein n=1 Tax=Barnesiella intestinihominis TaxID=487174 RepID=UPI003970C292